MNNRIHCVDNYRAGLIMASITGADLSPVQEPGSQERAELERQLQDAQSESHELRLACAAAEAARQSDRAAARESVDRAQDLDAALFRLRDQLKIAQTDAESSYGRGLDLERQLRELCVQRDAVLGELVRARTQYEALSVQLSQTLTLHQQHASRYQSEFDLALALHEQYAARWRAELDQARRAHSVDTTRWQAELDQGRDDVRRTQLELDLLRAQADASAGKLAEVLGSRSWRLTRVLRQIVEGARGRRWVEPSLTLMQGPISAPGRKDSGEESSG